MIASDTDGSAQLPQVVNILRRGRVGAARVRRHKKKYWELDFGRRGGKHLRYYRKCATKALNFARQKTKELWEHGQFAKAFTTAQYFQMTQCFTLLAPLGKQPLDVINEYVKQHPLGGRARTLVDVTGEVLAKKKAGGRDKHYIQDLGYKLAAFERTYPGRNIAAPTTDEIERFLAGQKWSPVTQRSFVQALNVVFNYSVKRGYRNDNPCEKLDLPRVVRKEPCIFTIPQVQQMMTLAQSSDDLRDNCLAYVAIGTFAGLRPTEIERLDWEQISFTNGTITVLAPNAKNRSRRVVDIKPVLAAWLMLVAKEKGPVIKYECRVPRDRMKKAMKLAKWPHDVMRHSFGTYHFAKWRSERETVFQMGHGKDTDVFFSHYRALVQPAAADAFWEILPGLAA